MSETDQVWVCRVCRTGVSKVETRNRDGSDVRLVGWVHAAPGEGDHEPDPVVIAEVPGGEVRTICDICGEPDPRFAWAVRPHEFRGRNTASGLVFRDETDTWFVCAGCVPLVRAGDLAGLVRRRLDTTKHRWPERVVSGSERVFIADRVRDFLDTKVGEPLPRA